MTSVAELRQLLKEDAKGKNLYDHLTETLMKILIDRPENAYDAFELISAEVKENPFDPNPLKGRAIPASGEELKLQSKWTGRNSKLLKVPEEPLDDSGVKYPDVTNDANLYEWAGISFGKAEIYRLYLSIKAFAADLPAEIERIRFFGKITTRSAPYYVIEGLSADDEEADEAIQESRAGANKYTYWVTQRVDAADGWIQLPNVTCDQIIVARQIKRLFTGDLSASVPSYPPFSGTEKNLLRAKIAIIVGETSISPDGFFELDDSEHPLPQPVDAETLIANFPKSSSDLNFAEAWKHHETKLNKIGRITAPPEKLDENGEVIEPDDSADVVEALSPALPEEWTFRVAPGGAGTASGSIVIARSLAWPGAMSIASASRFINIYVGNAVRFSASSYCPPMPCVIQPEFATAEDDAFQLIEQEDARVDPTPPQPEDEQEEEED